MNKELILEYIKQLEGDYENLEEKVNVLSSVVGVCQFWHNVCDNS